MFKIWNPKPSLVDRLKPYSFFDRKPQTRIARIKARIAR